nr:EOG090X01LO [Ilyocryptus agilis]
MNTGPCIRDLPSRCILTNCCSRLFSTCLTSRTRVSSILYWGQENQQMMLTVGLCLLAGAILVAAVIVFLLRSRYIARQKLKDLTQSVDSEATRDYQDLCRARMATKSSNSTDQTGKESTKTPHPHLSRDSESSRSSTSSWCEEPVVTNMDISTGHMVLSYMEDHLRNKDRLDQEWQGLCAYEAEPSTSVLVASKPEHRGKNRYQDVLPYDHSRVVLNSIANVTGSDYINASYIADHDPRHPAYIAAQSPVEDSIADFWQMIWEQGSVVLVLLTRLNENGQSLCQNYWPEEGSQLYHIYEVHLVSEHIWCDDYLVRSFYLKNVRTGETRTVTQFHFLSWPENGVPSSTKALLEFRRKVNKSYRGRSCPIVVHCSDGAGRTGTYCLIDMVLHRMAKGAREIDIAATLEHLRDQRPQAVRTKQQFEFVLTAVAEEVHAILRALPQ